jgi:hypothetical protein
MAQLTEQEKQEIVRYLEADKPLPDKYRFLLFEEKREVELVWNGKTSEVCNIVLPFQVIEQVDEPRAEKPADTALQPGLFDSRGRQLLETAFLKELGMDKDTIETLVERNRTYERIRRD